MNVFEKLCLIFAAIDAPERIRHRDETTTSVVLSWDSVDGKIFIKRSSLFMILRKITF